MMQVLRGNLFTLLFLILVPSHSYGDQCELTCPAFADKVNSLCIGSNPCHDWVCNPKFDKSNPGPPTRIILQEANKICKSVVETNTTGARTVSNLEAARAVFSDFREILETWSDLYSKCGNSEESRSLCWENLPKVLTFLTGFRNAFKQIAESNASDAALKLRATTQVKRIDDTILKIKSQVQ